MKCYLIIASTGEYDAYQEWPVKVFVNKNSAIKFTNQLNDLSQTRKFDELKQLDSYAYCVSHSTLKYVIAELELEPN